MLLNDKIIFDHCYHIDSRIQVCLFVFLLDTRNMTFSQSIHQVWTKLADGSGGPQTLLAVQKYKLHCEKICFLHMAKQRRRSAALICIITKML